MEGLEQFGIKKNGIKKHKNSSTGEVKVRRESNTAMKPPISGHTMLMFNEVIPQLRLPS